MGDLSEDFKEVIERNSRQLHIPVASYVHIVKTSFTQSQEDILDLAKAIEQKNYEQIKALAHRLKGVYSNLRLPELFIPAQEMDALAKEQGEIKIIEDFFVQFKKAFEETMRKFQ